MKLEGGRREEGNIELKRESSAKIINILGKKS